MRFLLFIALAFIFTACGGGVGQDGTQTTEQEMGQEVVVPEEMETAEPCYQTDLDTLTAFLYETSPDRIVRWTQPPTLRIVGEATSQERRIVERVVNKINESLPSSYEIRPGESVSPRSSTVPKGEIYVEFAPGSEWIGHDGNAIGWTDTTREEGQIVSSHVWIQKNRVHQGFCDESLAYLVSHELLHALGFDHVGLMWKWESVLVANKNNSAFVPSCDIEELSRMETPGQIDKDALRAFYVLENGDYPQDFTGEECNN